MERLPCPRCKRNVEPIKCFDRSPKTNKAYLIVRCPFDRCKWNFDIEDYIEHPKSDTGEQDDGRYFWKDLV